MLGVVLPGSQKSVAVFKGEPRARITGCGEGSATRSIAAKGVPELVSLAP